MNTVLIVEDNDYERNALLHYINWDVFGLRVVAVAHNGQDGLEKAMTFQPDIILSDVMMPGMNGIEMAKSIVNVRPNTKFIFSSGHDDVALLKDAFEVRAYSYLIKPLKPEELIAVLKKVSSVSMEEKLSEIASKKMTQQFDSNLQHLQTKFLEDLIFGMLESNNGNEIYARAHDLKLHITGSYKLALVEFDFEDRVERFERSAQLRRVMSELDASCQARDVLLVKDGDSRILVIVHSLKEGSRQDSHIVQSIESRLASLSEECSFRYVVGVSSAAPNLTDLHPLYRQCCSILEGRIAYGYGGVVPFDQAHKPANAVLEPDPERTKRIIADIVTAVCEGGDAEEGVRQLMQAIATGRRNQLHTAQSSVIGLYGRLSRQLGQMGENIEQMIQDEMDLIQSVIAARTLPDIEACLRHTLRHVSAYMRRQQMSKEDSVVQEVLSILNRDYAQPITLSYLSERVYLSPNYLRLVFKDKMNISIQDYLTQLRINKAKELLRERRYKIHEIGEMVGYENSTYFNLVFKKSVHMTPGEYRARLVTQMSG